MAKKAIVITESVTYADHRQHATPSDFAAAGLGGLLERLRPQFEREGTVLVDAGAARALGLPDTPGTDEEMTDHPATVGARAAGWKVRRLGPWTTLYGDNRPAVQLGVLPWIDPAECPMVSGGHAITAGALALWHEVTGSAYHGTVSVAGLTVLTNGFPNPKTAPTWKPKLGGPGDQGVEDDLRREYWRGPLAGKRYAHGYDATRAYVSACMGVKLSPYQLKRTGKLQWDPQHPRAGWWEVELSPWNLRHMPDPAGYDPSGQGRTVRWIAQPTMELLHALTELGVYGGVRVLDSWTGPAKELLKPWATTMRSAFDAVTDPASGYDPHEAQRVAATIKDAGRGTLGLLNRPTNYVHRPDWWYSIVSLTRANLWRKAWKIGTTEDRWPLWFDVDNIWYASDIDDPREACPVGLKLAPVDRGAKLGEFTVKGTRQRRADA